MLVACRSGSCNDPVKVIDFARRVWPSLEAFAEADECFSHAGLPPWAMGHGKAKAATVGGRGLRLPSRRGHFCCLPMPQAQVLAQARRVGLCRPQCLRALLGGGAIHIVEAAASNDGVCQCVLAAGGCCLFG